MMKAREHGGPSSRLGRMREALRQSEELHRIILTNISDSVFLTDGSDRFTFICPNVDNIFGYSSDEIYAMGDISRLIGKGLYAPEKLHSVTEIKNIERTVRDKGGAKHSILINVKNVNLKYGARLFTCRDITDYRRIKEELLKSDLHRKRIEKDFALFFTLSADMFTIRYGQLLKKVNPAWEAVLGYPPGQLAGMSITELVHPDDLSNTLSLENRLRPGDVLRYENRCRHKDGSYRWISWNSTMSDDWHIYTVGRDVTAKRNEIEEIRRRLLRFKLQRGRVYLVMELSPMKLAEAFRELMGLQYAGVVITRREEGIFSGGLEKGFRHLWLSDRGGKGTIRPDTAQIEALVDSLLGEHVIVIDSLEFLIRKCGFPSVLSFVGHLREIALFKNHIILIGADASCLDPEQTTLLEKETLQMERQMQFDLPEDAIQVLRKVYEDNSAGIRPTRTRLCRSLGLSHPTLRRRLAELKSKELLWESKVGRSVIVELTHKGRTALDQ